MNVVILKSVLKDGLAVLSGIRKDTGSLPILKNILLEAKDNCLTLVATDLEIGIRHTLLAKVIQEGSITIPYTVFSQIVSNLSFERVSLEVKGSFLLIIADSFKAKIAAVSKDDFPIIPQPQKENGESFVFNSSQLVDAFSAVVSSCHVSDIKPELSGVYFTFTQGIITCVGTDSFRLSEKTILEKQFQTHSTTDCAFTIPLKTVQEIIRIFSQKNTKITLSFVEHQIVIEDETTHLVSRVIEGRFPDYKQIIPASFITEVTIKKSDLISSLKLSGSLSNRLFEVRFLADENGKTINVYSASTEFGESESILPAKIKGEKISITFNWRYILEGLKSINSDDVYIGFNGEDKATIMRDTHDKSFVYVLMPIKSL